jgi:hypothetical protein
MFKPVRLWLALVLIFALGLSVFSGTTSISAAPSKPGGNPANSKAIPGEYIVVLKDNVSDVDTMSRSLETRLGFTKRYTYRSALKGFVANVSDSRLAALKADPNVAYIVQDQVVTLQDFRNPGKTPAQVKAALQAAGTLNWSVNTDRDPVPEKLLNVSGF